MYNIHKGPESFFILNSITLKFINQNLFCSPVFLWFWFFDITSMSRFLIMLSLYD